MSQATNPESKERVAFATSDVSSFARALTNEIANRVKPLADEVEKPKLISHLTMLNCIARAGGFRNFQALRASATRMPPAPLALPVGSGCPTGTSSKTEQTASLTAAAAKALGHFDSRGRLLKWPTKFSVQSIALWGLWMRIQSKRTYTEREITALLSQLNAFNDPVTLRRELINHKLMARKADCSAYWKEQKRADEEALAFLKALRAQIVE
jgi:hypothetical protein